MNATAIHGGLVGRVVGGRFTLLRWLSSHRGVETYLTEFGDPSQKATIKLVPGRNGEAEIRMSAWLAAVNLSHPHLIKVFTSGRCEIDSSPMLYVVTEYADEVLAEILPERALMPEEAREMLGPAVDALAYLHAKGFVHGRLKPSNIMAVGEKLKLSADGLILAGAIGKPPIERTIYDAPETIQGRIGPAADVWALGATLVEVLTQQPPAWYGAAAIEPVVPDTVAEPFATIARECLRKDVARRCTLEQIRTRLDPDAAPPPPKTKSVLDFKARPAEPNEVSERAVPAAPGNPKRRRTILVAAALVLLAVFAIVELVPHHEQPPQPAPEAQSASPAVPVPAPKAAQPQPAEESPTQRQPVSPPPASAVKPAAAQSAIAPPQPPAPAPPPESSPQTPPTLPSATQSSPSGKPRDAVTQQVDPDVPASAMRTISGTVRVVVRVSVDATGKVTDASFDSAGPSKYFAGRAMDAARRWRFTPAEMDGQAVASVWILQFDFRQSGVTASSKETSP